MFGIYNIKGGARHQYNHTMESYMSYPSGSALVHTNHFWKTIMQRDYKCKQLVFLLYDANNLW